jgi:hypothetical protein
MVSSVGRTCVADPDPIGLMDPDLIMSVGSEPDSDYRNELHVWTAL